MGQPRLLGNLPFTATDEEITELFGQHGTVHSVALINDPETGGPRGFGFVEMDDDAAAAAGKSRPTSAMSAKPRLLVEAGFFC